MWSEYRYFWPECVSLDIFNENMSFGVKKSIFDHFRPAFKNINITYWITDL